MHRTRLAFAASALLLLAVVVPAVAQSATPEKLAASHILIMYVGSERVEMVYVPSGPALAGVTRSELEECAGTQPTLLRSRAGKEYVHYSHPEQGIAYSSEGDKVRFVEIFRPRSLNAYKAEIYRDPGPFIR